MKVFEVKDESGAIHKVEAEWFEIKPPLGAFFYKEVTKTWKQPRRFRAPKIKTYIDRELIAFHRDPYWVRGDTDENRT